ncbi:mRNA-binding phosphate metabolism regulator [Sporothrix schenckii 1099-18]|uniref:YTH domain-containing protein n=2 Tax=Sporothrix schenckii TaxID=29908 RepID=U7Q061_SPOS1|nr:mRNA-binding phosphate metabolism regulator [Sporothrix schenckii 1099-18]ERT01294.1 hypothetical protein HMPREF1624_02536 [Sporothrix schenckii ATCC 58251]KJR88465.1 hypothetical protein SPSK_07034 [Sporothrix schenckii 1099-18]
MADPTRSQEPLAPVESRQQEQQEAQQQNTPVHSPTSPSSSFPHRQSQQSHSPSYQHLQDPRQPQHPRPHQFAHSNMQQPYYRPPGPGGGPHSHGAFDMHGMAQSLPQADYRQQQQYGAAGNRAGPRSYAMGPGASLSAHYNTHPGGPAPAQQGFYLPHQPPMMGQHYYGTGPVPATAPRHAGGTGGYGYYAGQAPSSTGYYYRHPGQYVHQPQHQHHQPVAHPQGGMPGGGMPGGSAPGIYTPAPNAPRRPSQPVVVTSNPLADGLKSSPNIDKAPRPVYGQSQPTSVVRGPPRKPKQSGHAIWIGNLPPQTNLMSLVHHVCQQTDGLESLFLISKSNCAFANYPDEERCLAAQQKLNDTSYMSVRLVSRLRKTPVEGAQSSMSPTKPTALSTATSTGSSPPQGDEKTADEGEEASRAKTLTADERRSDDAPAAPKKPPTQTSVIVDGSGKSGAPRRPAGYETDRAAAAAIPTIPATTIVSPATKSDRYFILKSLTVEDLELSVRTGIWATQSHNEETLNDAFKSCQNVYLVFSANKSGEYFGYARMTSEINQDPAAAIAFAPTSQSFSEVDLPKAIPTDATETTPRGRIIDDSARGTIFWEAQRDDADEESEENKKEEGSYGADGAEFADGVDGVDGVDTVDGVDGTDKTGGADGVDGDVRAGTTDAIDGTDGVDGADGDDPKVWGKPFQLEWLSTTRLPFYRTRGMRNPLNANREIKIARDGTEVDPAVGRKLTSFFHQSTLSASNT